MAISAEKPRLGVRAVIFFPTVEMTLEPRVARPKTIPIPPTSNTHGLIEDLDPISPVSTTLTTAAKGPIAFATSFEPWAKAMALAETIISNPNANSMPPSLII